MLDRHAPGIQPQLAVGPQLGRAAPPNFHLRPREPSLQRMTTDATCNGTDMCKPCGELDYKDETVRWGTRLRYSDIGEVG